MAYPDPPPGPAVHRGPESLRDDAPPALDLRALPAPEPLVRALAAADALAPGAVLEVLTPMLPLPLLQQLIERGLHASAELLANGSARVRVRRR